MKTLRRPAAVHVALALASALLAGCASPDMFERAKLLLDAESVHVVVNTSGYADNVNFGGAKAEARGDRRIATAELDLFYDRNDNHRLDDAESIGHWSHDSRDKPAATVLLLPGNKSGFKSTGIPVQRLLYQVTVTFADGGTATGTLRANEK